jgi:hypothetical protein
MTAHHEPPDRNPAVAELLDDAYVSPVGVEVAARHLWAIHTAAKEVPQIDPPTPVESLATRRVPRAAVPVLALVMMMSSSGMALAASQSSLPGDVLYPVKRGTEQAQLIFARSPEARAQLQLSFAQTRLEEIRRIAATRPQHVPALVAAINVTLSQVEVAAPEDSDRVRREVDAEIASLELPATASPLAQADGSDMVTATAPSPSAASSTTEPAGTGGATATEGPTAAATPAGSDADVAVGDGSGATGTSTEDGATDATAEPDAQPTDADPTTAEPTDAEPTDEPTATTTPTDGPSSSPTPTASPSDGPIVTTRPHTDETPGGSSRTEDPDESGEPAEPGEADQPSDDSPAEPEPSPSGQVQPYTRPTD